MKKFMTKVLSVFLCIAFTGLQMSFADVLTTGQFADRDVLTGAQIKGHTAGLYNITGDLNSATLHFNNHTRIDWNSLNVYKDQSLTFNNGQYGVLNNVVGTSISKFAGSINATGTGKIIICNPNGILFEGGKFESAGGLILTTKDLTSIAVNDGTDLNNINIANYGYGEDNVAIVAIANSSNIKAADINIISQGVYVDSSTLASSDSNGIILVTADGANFVATHSMTAQDGSTKNITLSTDTPATIANSSIITNNGELQLVSGRHAALNNVNVTGNLNTKSVGTTTLGGKGTITGNANLTSTRINTMIQGSEADGIKINGKLTSNANKTLVNNAKIGDGADVTATFITVSNSNITGNTVLTDSLKSNGEGIRVVNSNINGNLDINGKDYVQVDYSTAGDTKIVTDSFVQTMGSTYGNTSINAGGYVRIGGPDATTTVNGNLDIESFTLILGYFETNAEIMSGKLNVTGDLTANIQKTIGYSDVVTAKNISLTSQESSILAARSQNGTGILVSENTTVNANGGVFAAVNGNVANNTSDYYQCVSKELTPETIATITKNYVLLEGGSATITTLANAYVDADLTGDLTINAPTTTRVTGSIGNDLNITTASGVSYVTDALVGNDLNVTASAIRVSGSTVDGNATLVDNVNNSGGIIVNTSTIGGNLDIDSANSINVTEVSAGKTTIDTKSSVELTTAQLGDTTINADSYVRIGKDTTVTGDLNIDSFSLILGYFETDATVVPDTLTVSGNLTANVESTIGYTSEITANEISLTSQTSSIFQGDVTGGNASLNADKITLSTPNGYVAALDANAVNGTSEYYEAVRTQVTKDNFETVVGKSAVETNPITVGSSQEGGNLDLTMDTTVINVISNAGNTTLNVVPETVENVVLQATGDITAENITVKKDSNDTNDTTGNATFVSTNGSITIKDITADNNIEATAQNAVIAEVLKADADNNGVGDITINAGTTGSVKGAEGNNVNIKTGDNATINDVVAKNDVNVESTNGGVEANNVKGNNDVTITANNDIIAKEVIADADKNGQGDLTITSKNGNVNIDGGYGKNVDVDSAVDTIVKNVTAGDNIDVNAGGSVVAENIIADADKDGIGDITITAGTTGSVDGAEGNNVNVTTGDDAKINDVVANNDVNVESKNGDVDADKINAGNDVNITNNNGNTNADDVKAGDDITITAGGDVTGSDLIADKNNDNDGDLTINAGGDVNINGGEGQNVNIDTDKNADVSNITGKDDVTIKADGDVTGDNLIADGNKDGVGDLTIEAGGNGTVTGGEGENVDITTGGNANVTDITGNDDVTIKADGDVTGDNLVADADKDGVGDLTIEAGGNGTITGGEGENVDITTGGDANVTDITGNDDVTIDAGGNVDGDNLVADADNDGVGDLTINGDKDVDVNGGEGENVNINSGEDTNVTDTTAKDDINIDAGGNVTGDGLTADGDKDGKGDININAGGDVDIDNSTGNKININTNGDVNTGSSTASNGIFYNGINIDSNTLTDEVIKNLNNLQQSGVNTAMAQSFTPIAFAADDDDEEQSMLAKKIAKTVFKTEDGTVTITDRFNPFKQ